MKIHFIAIGGAAMHNLALALNKKGNTITGSDDEIFEPSRSRLEQAGILPEKFGWFPEKIDKELDAVILGMHAREDNQELIRAQQLGLKIYSYPEFLYQQTRNKTRVVIGGSHGKTTITSMVMHVLKSNSIPFDYMVGSQIDGFDTMVSLDGNTSVAVFEGDEYLSSPIDRRPKFHLYHPQMAVISGIAWDHINVFRTFSEYRKQFEIFIDKVEVGGTLYYNGDDEATCSVINEVVRTDITIEPYFELKHEVEKNVCKIILSEEESVPLKVFGKHNMQNMSAAMSICTKLGISATNFYESIGSFSGSRKRMQKLYEDKETVLFLDFAHAPSKVAATLNAVSDQFSDHRIIAILELHTYSSLNKEFLTGYKNSLDGSDKAIVMYSPEVVKHKKLPEISKNEILNAFSKKGLTVINTKGELTEEIIQTQKNSKEVFLFMSSGNFDGLSVDEMINVTTNKRSNSF